MSNTEEIIKGNKAIAEFMNYSQSTEIHVDKDVVFYSKRGSNIWYIGDERRDKYDEFLKLEFHSSWDWLMPVVEKIASMVNDYPAHVSSVTDHSIATPIHNVWQACVDFIEWYNHQSK